MKKKSMQILLGLGLVAALVAVLLVLRQGDEAPAEGDAEDAVYVLGGFPAPFVGAVEIKNEQDSFTIKNDFINAIQQENASDDRYSLPGLSTDTLNQSMLKSVINTASGLAAKKVVAQGEVDLSRYGLRRPRAQVAVQYENGDALMLIGEEAPGGEGTYVSVGDTVYLVSSSSLNNLLQSRYAFASQVMSPGNSMTTSLAQITLSGEKYAEPLIIARDTDAAAGLTGSGSYALVYPVTARLDAGTALPLLSGVFGLSADEVLGERGDDLGAWGLDEPWLAAEVVSGDAEVGSFSLSFSEPDEAGDVFAISSTSPYVYKIASEWVLFYDLDLFEIRDKVIAEPAIDRVREVEITTPDASYLFALSGEGDALAVEYGGEVIDTENFRAFYQTLVSARYDSVLDVVEAEDEESATEEAEGEEQEGDEFVAPSLQIAYRYRDDSVPDILRFYPGPTRKAVVSLNGGESYYTQSIYLDRVLEDVVKVAQNLEVKPYFS